MAYENILSLNDTEFTDQGRTLSESREERAVSVQLASGKIKKYVMGEKKRWSLEWSWLPNSSSMTHDGKAARDQLRAIAYTGNTVTMLVRNTYGQTDTYTVWVESYSEDVIRRDTVNGEFFYNVSIELMEQ
jgi:hypothetical protein